MIFKRNYFVFALLIFIVEVLIALFARDNFVRPYVGDVLVVILLYCFVKSFFRLDVYWVAFGVLMFAFVIEFLQYLNIVKILGLESSSLARTVIGTSFAWYDIVAYMAGIALVLLVERRVALKAIVS
ncbi:MAG: DUF2809 domain-containing protein [Cyclobacteriaceae bacterium]|nr:DUF2809 domain-containing protein [Cyclobacteriaceae bacterium]